MSAVRLLARPALVAGAALLAVGSFALPAAADSVSLRLDGLPGRMVAGGGAAGLRVSVSNPRPDTITDVQMIYTIRLDGLEASQVRFTKIVGSVQVSGGSGEVRAVDTAHLFRGRATTMVYSLQFLAGAPAGRATVTTEAFRAGGGLGDRLGSTRESTTVQSTRASPTRGSPEPTPTLALGPADAQPGASNSPVIAPRADPGGSDGDNALWPLYVVGILLVLGGGGAAAFLLLKRPHEGEAADEYGGAPYPGAFAHLDAPTTVLPRVPAGGGYGAGYPMPDRAAGGYPAPGQPPAGHPFNPPSRTEPLPPADDPWRDEGGQSGRHRDDGQPF